MNPYNDAIVEMLSSHIVAKDQAIQTLAGIIKNLADDLKDTYIKLQTIEAVASIPTKKLRVPVKSVVRWQHVDEYKRWGNPNRAIGIVYNDCFFEFARTIDGNRVVRTSYASLDDWIASLPVSSEHEFTYTR